MMITLASNNNHIWGDFGGPAEFISDGEVCDRRFHIGLPAT